MIYPNEINILGTVYTVSYHDRPIDVDKNGRTNHCGQIDYWDKVIRIHNSGNAPEMWKTIFHEILHAIGEEANIKMLDDEDNHKEIDLLSKVLIDTIIRNNFEIKDKQ